MTRVRARLAVAVLIAASLGMSCSDGRELRSPTQGQPPTEVSVSDLTVGQCFNDQNAVQRAQRTVLALSCSLNHDNQLYALVALTGGPDYPGAELLDSDAFAACEPLFQPFVNRPYGESSFEIVTLTPSMESWNLGDRDAGCAIYKTDRSTWVGTAQNSGL